ncbi:MAG: PD-(D/E)XK nuclease family protein [Deltaproteobacteria bacterium]|nr:PD-(D/E)XK nuclease family protein [Deltaproteobacteria bacterium]
MESIEGKQARDTQGADPGRVIPDFDRLTFLERLSVAAREPVWTAAFAWVLGEDSPLPVERRLEVLGTLCGEPVPWARKIVATTEWKHIDVLLRLFDDAEREVLRVAIENKLKATEGDDQLQRYDNEVKTDLPVGCEVRKLYLTVQGEKSRSGDGWVPRSYADLRKALCEVLPNSDPGTVDPYVRDLCAALGRLSRVATAVMDDPDVARVAFQKDLEAESPCARYIRNLRLEKLVQRLWMTALRGELVAKYPWIEKDPWTVVIGKGESRGDAYLTVRAMPEDGLAISVDVQGLSVKLGCVPEPYPEPRSVLPEQRARVEFFLEAIRSRFELGGVTASRDGGRGFRSFTVDKTLPNDRGRMASPDFHGGESR